LLHDVLLM